MFTALAATLAVLTLVYRYRCSRGKGDLSSRSRGSERRNFDEEKSNNLQNEETFRRFANPLKENATVVCNPEAGCSPVIVADLPAKINVVRPISHASAAEMMEMISDTGGGDGGGKGVCAKALLSKTQNSAFQKTAALADGCMAGVVGSSGKEMGGVGVKPLNVNVISPNQRLPTGPLQPNSSDDCSSNVFTTVLV